MKYLFYIYEHYRILLFANVDHFIVFIVNPANIADVNKIGTHQLRSRTVLHVDRNYFR